MEQVTVQCQICGHEISVTDAPPGGSENCPECGATIEVPEGTGEEDAGLMGLLEEEPEPAELSDSLVAASLEDLVAETGEAEEAPAAPPRGEPAPAEMDYRLWQGLAEQAGDWAMAVRLDSWRRAGEAGCRMALSMPDSVASAVPRMVLGEAAVAAFQSQSEAEWREAWTRRLLKVAAKWPDEQTVEGVVEVLLATDPVIGELREAGVWPW